MFKKYQRELEERLVRLIEEAEKLAPVGNEAIWCAIEEVCLATTGKTNEEIKPL